MRSPSKDPTPGDTLSYKGYHITVQERAGDNITYRVTKKGVQPRQAAQTLQQWSAWTGSAKVLQRGQSEGECVTVGFCVSGKCSVCGNVLPKEVHIVDRGLFCPSCCVAKVHGKANKAKGVTA